jgi:hypothetical protein
MVLGTEALMEPNPSQFSASSCWGWGNVPFSNKLKQLKVLPEHKLSAISNGDLTRKLVLGAFGFKKFRHKNSSLKMVGHPTGQVRKVPKTKVTCISHVVRVIWAGSKGESTPSDQQLERGSDLPKGMT